jgi:hypothetical protein
MGEPSTEIKKYGELSSSGSMESVEFDKKPK